MSNEKKTVEPRNLDDLFITDAHFNQLYPTQIRLMSARHWTPLRIIQKAVEFLTPEKGVKVLDIGSGAGKFCIAGAYYKPGAFFFGVEQRKDMVAQSEKVLETLDLPNVHFIHRNFTQLDLTQYDHFYFYNSFYENLVGTDKIDDSIEYTQELYNYYNRYLYRKLEGLPAGTRLVTFHGIEHILPPEYHPAESQEGNLLKFWLKI